MISITIIHAHCSKGHGAYFLAPVTMVWSQLAAILYVDNTDILHLNMDQEESIFDVHRELQESLLSWVKLLKATGDTIQPEKCSYHLIDFSWSSDGAWKYVDHSKNGNTSLFMPLPNGSLK